MDISLLDSSIQASQTCPFALVWGFWSYFTNFFCMHIQPKRAPRFLLHHHFGCFKSTLRLKNGTKPLMNKFFLSINEGLFAPRDVHHRWHKSLKFHTNFVTLSPSLWFRALSSQYTSLMSLCLQNFVNNACFDTFKTQSSSSHFFLNLILLKPIPHFSFQEHLQDPYHTKPYSNSWLVIMATSNCSKNIFILKHWILKTHLVKALWCAP